MTKKTEIDVIKKIHIIRNCAATLELIMQERNQYFSDIKINIDTLLEANNDIHRWFFRNPNALEKFNNTIACYDGDVEPAKDKNDSIA